MKTRNSSESIKGREVDIWIKVVLCLACCGQWSALSIELERSAQSDRINISEAQCHYHSSLITLLSQKKLHTFKFFNSSAKIKEEKITCILLFCEIKKNWTTRSLIFDKSWRILSIILARRGNFDRKVIILNLLSFQKVDIGELSREKLKPYWLVCPAS